jgi:hypothetical protein
MPLPNLYLPWSQLIGMRDCRRPNTAVGDFLVHENAPLAAIEARGDWR